MTDPHTLAALVGGALALALLAWGIVEELKR